MKQYKVLDIAKYIINKCTNENCLISNLHLQKILYLLQREFLQNTGYALFNDEIEAWQISPVVPDVYYQYCAYGSRPIMMNYYDINIDNDDINIIDPIIENKREKEPWDLVKEARSDGGAWTKIYNNGLGDKCIIPKNLIISKG